MLKEVARLLDKKARAFEHNFSDSGIITQLQVSDIIVNWPFKEQIKTTLHVSPVCLQDLDSVFLCGE